MTCYIIDDEQHAIDTLIRYIDKIPELTLAGSSTSSTQAIAALKNLPAVNLIFLDIDMPDISGLEAIDLLPAQAGLIFTTAHSGYAYDAFQNDALDFLLKPISFARFTKAVNKAESWFNHKQNLQRVKELEKPASLFINPGTRGKVIQLKLEDIIYIEGLKNYVVIYTATDKHITYLTLTETLAALPGSQFVRIHKSFVINLLKIKAIEGNHIEMENQITLNIGVSYKDPFMELIALATLKSKR